MDTTEIVSDTECDSSKKPSATTKQCNLDECPNEHVWNLEKSHCSVECGGGIIIRIINKIRVVRLFVTLSVSPSTTLEV